MSLTKEGADKLIHQIQDEFYKHWMANDVKSLVGLYHSDAVLINKGQWAVYGIEDISKKYETFLSNTIDFKLHFNMTVPAADGEYIIHHGDFEFKAKPGVLLPYQQIYKKTSDGKYLIYHDIFEM